MAGLEDGEAAEEGEGSEADDGSDAEGDQELLTDAAGEAVEVGGERRGRITLSCGLTPQTHLAESVSGDLIERRGVGKVRY